MALVAIFVTCTPVAVVTSDTLPPPITVNLDGVPDTLRVVSDDTIRYRVEPGVTGRDFPPLNLKSPR